MILSYLGSKSSLMYNLSLVMRPYITEHTRFCDAFSGSGVVSNFYKNICNVSSVDQELYAYVLTYALTKTIFTPNLKNIIQELNTVQEKMYGLVSKHFAPPCRKFFTLSNAMCIDNCRVHINNLYNQKQITYEEFMFLMASLLCSASKVANTCGTFRAYLKNFSKRAQKDFKMLPIHTNIYIRKRDKHSVYCSDSIHHLSKHEYDVIYLDPPYNNIHYGAYYSFLNYLCEYKENISLTPAGVCKDYKKSLFGMKKYCNKAFFDLFNVINPNTKHVFMSYSSNGVLTIRDLKQVIMNSNLNNSQISIYKQKHKAYMSRQTQIIEYIIHIRRID